ncbi:MAG: polysaccharide deacetylase family protein [Clostridiales bacterium]|jgi:peptidoglycan-N-acetylmuramic acid deacetylase|nr:polysaccharide deacetylase family protein [Clostridiales bacterium]
MKKSQLIALGIIFVVFVILLFTGLNKARNQAPPVVVNLNVTPTGIVTQTQAPTEGPVITPTLANPVESQTPDATRTPEAINTPEETPTPTPSPEPTPLFPELDKDALSNLSTERIGWYFTVVDNNGKTLLGILDKDKALINKYGAIYTKDTSQKFIYLTFDESYEGGYTSTILDSLKANNVKATFFVTGQYINDNPDLVKRMISEGHLVGNMADGSLDMPSLSIDDFVNQLMGAETKYRALFGENSRMYYYRSPSGYYSERDLALTKQLGYTAVFWSYAYGDYFDDPSKIPSEDTAISLLTTNAHNGAVYLLHASSKINADIIGRVIDSLRVDGYEFKRIDQ